MPPSSRATPANGGRHPPTRQAQRRQRRARAPADRRGTRPRARTERARRFGWVSLTMKARREPSGDSGWGHRDVEPLRPAPCEGVGRPRAGDQPGVRRMRRTDAERQRDDPRLRCATGVRASLPAAWQSPLVRLQAWHAPAGWPGGRSRHDRHDMVDVTARARAGPSRRRGCCRAEVRPARDPDDPRPPCRRRAAGSSR